MTVPTAFPAGRLGRACAGTASAMDAVSFGKAGLQGWRAKLADGVVRPVAERARVDVDQAQAAVGAVFFLLSVVYVIGTIRRIAGQS